MITLSIKEIECIRIDLNFILLCEDTLIQQQCKIDAKNRILKILG
jgi:hypothetical protein